MPTHKFPSLAELTTSPVKATIQAVISGRFGQHLRDRAKDKIIDRLNAGRTDGCVIYGNKYVRNGKRFSINDSSHSPFREFNRRRIFDLFDALHNDPETRELAYPKVFISNKGGDYYCPGKLWIMAEAPDNIHLPTTKSFFPHIHLELRDGELYPEAALHEFGHHRDITLRGLWHWPHDITEEEKANDRLHHEDQAADHAFRINQFFRPKYRLPVACLIQDRTHVLRANHHDYPANSYIAQIIKKPDEIGGRRRYMSLREPDGSTNWLRQLLPGQKFEPSASRTTILRLLTTKLAAARGPRTR